MPPGDIAFRIFGLLLHFTALAHFRFIEFGLQLIHGLLFVAVLAAVVLAHGYNTGRNVRDANGRFRFLDVLAACARGAENVNAQIGRIDFDFKAVVNFRVFTLLSHKPVRWVPAQND